MSKTVNYLDFVFTQNPEFTWDITKDGLVEITMENTGFFNRLCQKFFHRPRYSHISLDRLGSYVWQQIDGTKTVFDISNLVHEEFGEEAEPLYDRLIPYFRQLENHTMITRKKGAA